MDKIKFRSAHYNYDGTFNGFSYWGAIDRFGNIETTSNGFASPTSRSGTERKFEEQYTCIKDKLGKEIFEGDILERSTGERGKIIYNELFGMYDFSSLQREFNSPLYNVRSDSKVIGNIHQNPELLNS